MNILIIEDNLLTANDLKNTLINAGYNVTGIARSLQEAISEVEIVTPDLILLDIFLDGDSDGIEVAKAILAMKQIPIIVLTANIEESMYQRVKKAFTPAGYITKPFRHIDLPRLVDLARRNSRRESPDANSILQDIIFLPVEKRYEKILKSEVKCISTLKGTHSVHLFEAYRKTPRLVNLSLGHIQPYFSDPIFFRLSRSVVINLTYIDHIETTGIKIEGIETILPIPDANRNELLRKIGKK